MTVALTLDATERARLAGDLDRLGAGLTALAGLLLKPVAGEVLDHIRDAGMLADWPSQSEPASAEGLALLAESLAAGEAEVDIRQDYNQLFVGPERMTAPPYESVHRSQERLIFEQETFLVRAAYAEFGLAAPRLNRAQLPRSPPSCVGPHVLRPDRSPREDGVLPRGRRARPRHSG